MDNVPAKKLRHARKTAWIPREELLAILDRKLQELRDELNAAKEVLDVHETSTPEE